MSLTRPSPLRPSSSIIISCALLIFTAATCQADEANYVANPPKIDGVISQNANGDGSHEWGEGQWYPLNQDFIGGLPTKEDFSGEYTLRWDKDHLYLLAKINDDILFDQHPDPLYLYWDDDCLEIFIDEDASGGIHQFDYNAFAYHISIDNQSVDIGPNNADGSTNFILLNEHISSAWKRSSDAPHTITWEVAIKVIDDKFDETKDYPSVELTAHKRMGFMLAYCDNDGSKNRENFIGSHTIVPVSGDKNLGYIDASVFDTVTLKPAN